MTIKVLVEVSGGAYFSSRPYKEKEIIGGELIWFKRGKRDKRALLIKAVLFSPVFPQYRFSKRFHRSLFNRGSFTRAGSENTKLTTDMACFTRLIDNNQHEMTLELLSHHKVHFIKKENIDIQYLA